LGKDPYPKSDNGTRFGQGLKRHGKNLWNTIDIIGDNYKAHG
jgi:hypothetical protein